MTTTAKLMVFAAGVVAVFGGGAAIGAAVGPIGDGAPPIRPMAHQMPGDSPSSSDATPPGP